MKKVTLIPGPSWIEYLFTLKMRPSIFKDIRKKEKGKKGERKKEELIGVETWNPEPVSALSGIKHEAAIEPSAQTLHHKTVFQFCNHHL